jgi:hypothetical protein
VLEELDGFDQPALADMLRVLTRQFEEIAR